MEGTWGRPPGFVCNAGSGRPAPRPRTPGAPRGPGLQWLRPPLATRLPPAHLGSAPPPPPALCTPGSAGLCSALRGSSRRAGGGRGRSRPGPCSGATPPRAARGLAAAAGNPPAPAALGASPPFGPARGRARRRELPETKVAARRKEEEKGGGGGGCGRAGKGWEEAADQGGRGRPTEGTSAGGYAATWAPPAARTCPGSPRGGRGTLREAGLVLFSHTRELQGGG